MKTRLKKSLSVFLSIVMLLSVTAGLDLSAYAHEEYTSGGFKYSVMGDNTAKIEGYVGSETKLVIPSTIDGYKVTSIGDYAFRYDASYHYHLESITIPNSVTFIGYCAFKECSSLKSVKMPSNLKTISEGAFSLCTSLTSVTIPNSVKSICREAFYRCYSLTSVTIPNGVTSIGDVAFYWCSSLTSVTIPNSVTSIGKDAFCQVNNVNYNGSATGSPWGALYINGYVDGYLVYKDSKKKELIGCSAAATKITIPNSVKSIGDCAFCNCISLTSVKIPNSVTSIGEDAFRNCCSLTSVKIPNSVTSIGEDAFLYCDNLKSVTIGRSVTSIGYSAFDECYNLTDVYYRGSKEQWNKISIGANNGDLKNATFHYHTTHNKKKVVKKNIKRATLSNAGSYDSVVYCSLCDREMSRTKKTIPRIKSVKLGKTNFVYNGKVKKPAVTVKDVKGKTLKKGTDYTVTYANGRKNVGKYSVKITFKGLYKGTKTLYFTIKPKATSISKLTAGSKKFTVKWYKRDKQVTGYQIQYATNNKFNNAKTVTVSKNSTTSKTISKLSARKKYFVRVRTYKVVNGKKYFSAWSKAKSVTTKK